MNIRFLFDCNKEVVEPLNKIIREEETEYQGLISQIHASLQNEELYTKPYELILMGVEENTSRLVSELKRLNVSIKRHMDKQTNDMDANQVLEHFFKYHQDIGSKAYLRMKTGENIAYFRSSIIEKIDHILETDSIMERAVRGLMEIRQIEDSDLAYETLVEELIDIKSEFYRLDDIIEEIDKKHNKYMRNAVKRAEFLLATGNNVEGKISKILNRISDEIEKNDCSIFDISEEMNFSLYPQKYLSIESLQTIPIKKKNADISLIKTAEIMSEEERMLYKEALKQKNRRRFTRKNINEYVVGLLDGREKLPVTEIEISSKRDVIRIIYISIYSGNKANNYRIKRSKRRVKIGEYEIPYFEIEKRG